MRFLHRIREYFLDLRHPPAVVIERWGQATNRPQVGVSVMSRHGAQGVYTYDANEVGEASATMYGKGLSDITGLRLVDRRTAK